MTTNIQFTTNGNYVGELKAADGRVLGKAGPGTMKQSGSIYVPHNETVTFTERAATEEETAAEKAERDAADDEADKAE